MNRSGKRPNRKQRKRMQKLQQQQQQKQQKQQQQQHRERRQQERQHELQQQRQQEMDQQQEKEDFMVQPQQELQQRAECQSEDQHDQYASVEQGMLGHTGNAVGAAYVANASKARKARKTFHPKLVQTSNEYSQVVDGMRKWRNMYETALLWHSQHQMNFWRSYAFQLERRTVDVKQQMSDPLQKYHHSLPEEYETSSDDDEDETEVEVEKRAVNKSMEIQSGDDKAMDTSVVEKEKDESEVDIEYLKFLETTYKHREELKLKRQQEEAETYFEPI